MTAPGTYRLEWRFAGAVTGAGGRQLPTPEAQVLPLEVLPRSEDRLAEVCGQLAATATGLRDMGESLIAGRRPQPGSARRIPADSELRRPCAGSR